MSSRQDYVDYVRNVLGVKNIHGLVEATSVTTETIPLVIYVQDLLNYTNDERDLLQKMILAVKVPSSETQVLDLTQQRNMNSRMTVYLTQEIADKSKLQPNDIHTYSPRALLQKPALKKAAWDELQKVLHFFQQQPRP